ncbi:hypothetical protein [Bacillus rubiinfantis]|nr:hypothetical protein [Bacillus rubiinfantis]
MNVVKKPLHNGASGYFLENKLDYFRRENAGKRVVRQWIYYQ